MKVICGLGNPGGEYEATRHNVGWWALDLAQKSWGLPPFKRDGQARTTSGRLGDHRVRLIKPLTYMNLSGRALGPLLRDQDWDATSDLLVISDDVAIDVGRVRIRPKGSAGGHNGLKSIESVLRTQEYARLRIGVGATPAGVDQADWVLGVFGRDDRRQIEELLPDIVAAAQVWVEEGTDAAANRFNR